MSRLHEYQAWNRVLVYGLGVSGRATTRFLAGRGVEVVAVDRRPAEELGLDDLVAAGGFELAAGEPDRLPPAIDAVVVSPGVPLDRPLLADARRSGVPILAEVELAFAYLDGPVVGITGSNGKSTTTAMTGALLTAAGIAAEVCGNIGVPLISVVEGAPGRAFVVELSSFQLEAVSSFRPRAAALLNISADHLDRHGSLDSYRAAKATLFARQRPSDFAVLNADDPLVRDVATQARKRYFSSSRPVEDGCYLEGDVVVEVDRGGVPSALFRRADVSQPGEHNLENAMAAALLARSLGASPSAFGRALAGFAGLPHRMQSVALLDGVHWIDDSKGTNVAAVAKSLAGLEDASVHLILGGRGKGESFAPLEDLVRRKVRRLYLIGETAVEIRDALAPVLPAAAIELAEELPRAVERAAESARAGETVLLSPACASFDQYADFGERGRHFRTLVEGRTGGRVG